ncbi:MAG: hypothetical protein PVH40_07605 [Gemmatimonadales bacterium]
MTSTTWPPRRVAATVVAVTAVLACSGGSGGFPSIDGWEQLDEARVFDADNLWEYINGAAELFVAYDVRTCETADLRSGDAVVALDLYDMGTPLNAFGIFSRERAGERVSVPGATGAMVSAPYLALLVKGSTYAKVNVLEGQLTAESGRALLEALAPELPGEPVLPAEFDLLPAEGKVAGSEGFQKEGYLGLTELNDCIHAEYAGEDGETWEGFAMLAEDPAAAEAAWNALASEWESVDHGGNEVLFREIPYRGLVGVTRTEQGVFGASGAADQAELFGRLEAITQ